MKPINVDSPPRGEKMLHAREITGKKKKSELKNQQGNASVSGFVPVASQR
jgi:hypothetical protein